MSPRGKAQNEQMRQETFEKITKGSLEVFAKYGFYGATIKKITEATGLSYGLVYHYFPSKERVFSYLVEEALKKSEETFQKSLGIDGSPWEKIQKLAECLLDESLTGDSTLYFHVMLQALTQGDGLVALESKIEDYSKRIYEMMVPVVVAGQMEGRVVEGDPVALTGAFLSMIQGLALFAFQSDKNESLVTADILLNVLRN